MKTWWTATPNKVFRENVTLNEDKVYYIFNGKEYTPRDSVGLLIQELVADGLFKEDPTSVMIFEFVPVISSVLHSAVAGLGGEHGAKLCFRVRVYEKFTGGARRVLRSD